MTQEDFQNYARISQGLIHASATSGLTQEQEYAQQVSQGGQI